MSETKFIRKEREHLKVLQKRLDHLRTDNGLHPERSGNPAYPAGEANALAWTLAVLEGEIEPVDIRLTRIEHKLRVVDTRLGRIEHDLEEEE